MPRNILISKVSSLRLFIFWRMPHYEFHYSSIYLAFAVLKSYYLQLSSIYIFLVLFYIVRTVFENNRIKNKDILILNNEILNFLSTQVKVYNSVDLVVTDDPGNHDPYILRNASTCAYYGNQFFGKAHKEHECEKRSVAPA